MDTVFRSHLKRLIGLVSAMLLIAVSASSVSAQRTADRDRSGRASVDFDGPQRLLGLPDQPAFSPGQQMELLRRLGRWFRPVDANSEPENSEQTDLPRPDLSDLSPEQLRLLGRLAERYKDLFSGQPQQRDSTEDPAETEKRRAASPSDQGLLRPENFELPPNLDTSANRQRVREMLEQFSRTGQLPDFSPANQPDEQDGTDASDAPRTSPPPRDGADASGPTGEGQSSASEPPGGARQEADSGPARAMRRTDRSPVPNRNEPRPDAEASSDADAADRSGTGVRNPPADPDERPSRTRAIPRTDRTGPEAPGGTSRRDTDTSREPRVIPRNRRDIPQLPTNPGSHDPGSASGNRPERQDQASRSGNAMSGSADQLNQLRQFVEDQLRQQNALRPGDSATDSNRGGFPGSGSLPPGLADDPEVREFLQELMNDGAPGGTGRFPSENRSPDSPATEPSGNSANDLLENMPPIDVREALRNRSIRSAARNLIQQARERAARRQALREEAEREAELQQQQAIDAAPAADNDSNPADPGRDPDPGQNAAQQQQPNSWSSPREDIPNSDNRRRMAPERSDSDTAEDKREQEERIIPSEDTSGRDTGADTSDASDGGLLNSMSDSINDWSRRTIRDWRQSASNGTDRNGRNSERSERRFQDVRRSDQTDSDRSSSRLSERNSRSARENSGGLSGLMEQLTKAPETTRTSGGGDDTASSDNSTGSSGYTLLAAVLLAPAMLLAILYFVLRRNSRRPSDGETVPAIQQWPNEIRSRADVVAAFHAIVARTVAEAQAWWPHRTAAGAVSSVRPETRNVMEQLSRVYEKARYQPSSSDLSSDELQAARDALRMCR